MELLLAYAPPRNGVLCVLHPSDMPPKIPDPLPLDPLRIDTEAEAQAIHKLTDESRRDSRDSGSDTDGTNDTALDDEDFDWDRDDESQVAKTETKAKRGRAIWLAFMKLSRPFRVFLVAFLGVAILVTPLIIVNVRFRDSPVKIHVHVWSLWFTINWATSCGTYILVDFLPHFVIAVTALFGGSVERFKMQLEVSLANNLAFVWPLTHCTSQLVMAVKGWLKLTLDIVWAWVALSVIRAVYRPPGSYWPIINEVMQVRSPYRHHRQSLTQQ